MAMRWPRRCCQQERFEMVPSGDLLPDTSGAAHLGGPATHVVSRRWAIKALVALFDGARRLSVR
jgi:hypothetical protein